MNALSRLALLLILLAGPSHAYYSAPRTEPVQPVAGQAFDVLIDIGRCYGFVVPFPGEPEGRIEMVGSTIRIFQPGIRGLLCNIPPSTPRFRVEPLSPGDYTVEIHMLRLPVGEEVFLSSSTFTVVGAPPQSPAIVPAYSRMGLLALCIGIAVFAFAHRRAAS